MINMRVAQRMHKLARLKPGNLRHHHCQKRIRGNIERHPQKHVATALIKHAGKPVAGSVKLKRHMARRQRGYSLAGRGEVFYLFAGGSVKGRGRAGRVAADERRVRGKYGCKVRNELGKKALFAEEKSFRER